MPVVDSASIPPIEIGTFDAFHPQNSEFTGSSSGVFFVNTVFRAFAKFSQGTTGSAPTANSFKPASVDGFIGTAESNQEPVVENASSQLDGASTTHRGGERPTLGLQTYGISVRGLGNPPDPTLAKQLVMLYFEHWHPFFPFLHGPTFFDDLSAFYDNTLPDVQDASCERRRRMRLCRAVTYQCIFNIAAAAHPRGLPPTACIQSPLALLEVLGILSVDRDLASLQALMAAELYLVTIMSLRAASTIHGTLTRLIYHSGLHRCPFRYIQLPRDVREMRKRILWCAYTHDRYLSQSLGHPLGLQDSDIDVCMPGTELHKPVDTSHCRMSPQASPVNDINSHLPSDHPSASAGDAENVGSSTELPQQPRVNSSANGTLTNNQVLRNYQGSGGSAVNVQEQFAKYSQLVAEALELFHKSLHARSITRARITELTFKINSWWNGLPGGFQVEEDLIGETQTSKPSYAAFFAISYHHLLILINRPFLSLPIHTMDFRSSLQCAITASRDLISKLKHVVNDPFLMNYPVILSAVWMAGLVLAFATLLDMYPLSKSTVEITKCLKTLQLMGVKWPSAKHCHNAMKRLLSRLNDQPVSDMERQALMPTIEQSRTMEPGTSAVQVQASGEPRGTKRPREQNETQVEISSRRSGNHASESSGNASLLPEWAPIAQYNGPDFGFDALQFDIQPGEDQILNALDLNHTGLFDDMGWQDFSSG